MTEAELFEKMKRELYTGLICDVMDTLGYRNQALSCTIRPLEADNCKLAGRAKTILAVDVYAVEENPYEMEIRSIDSIRPGEVPVVCTNSSPNNGVWGGLLSTATKMRGGTGAVVDGLMRDTEEIRALGFPVFCSGYKPLDSNGRGKVIAMDCPVVVGGVRVEPGDVVFADFDGVVIIPAAIFDQVVERSFEKRERESHTKRELLEGKLLAEVYAKYGVL
ncbi:RraA family protein [uncultured Oscillibacter sp.]|uniref:RraA family protein n=1 Tax=uncultured Oscillibacter sp. TaxID=876091 RepID=UPI0025E4EBFD|nr:RraA family protein [uncultured Oscillibacter sp.]